jgi:hypothetical protein
LYVGGFNIFNRKSGSRGEVLVGTKSNKKKSSFATNERREIKGKKQKTGKKGKNHANANANIAI